MLNMIVDFLTEMEGGKPVDSCGIARKPRAWSHFLKILTVAFNIAFYINVPNYYRIHRITLRQR